MRELIEKMQKRVEASLADVKSSVELKLLAETVYELTNALSNVQSIERGHENWEAITKLEERVAKLEAPVVASIAVETKQS